MTDTACADITSQSRLRLLPRSCWWAQLRSQIRVWHVVYFVVLLLALLTRFYALGDRAVSHDETTHAKYGWNLYIGDGFRHDPLMHGPLLFEATALMYALFGVSDFSARLYAALTGVALVMAPLLFRRWIGRFSALLMSLLLLISPYITYYSRYTRHDIPILLFAVLLVWAVFRYLSDGEMRWLRWMGVFFALMYASKENAYIYTAIFLGLMALPFLWYVFKAQWARPDLIPIILGVLALTLIAGGVLVLAMRQVEIVPKDETGTFIGNIIIPWWGNVATTVLLASGLGLLVLVTQGVGAAQMRSLRLFDVLMVLASLTLPLGSALLMKFAAGVDMARFYQGMMFEGLASIPTPHLVGGLLLLAVSIGLGIALGLWWNPRAWFLVALPHYAVFFVLYTTLFTYGMGGLSGLVGGLMYWIGQQGEQRGSQPWYYYGIVGPLYEYMPIVISSLGGVWVIGRAVARFVRMQRHEATVRDDVDLANVPWEARIKAWLPWFLMGWAALSWVAYAVAGEKMPWLFVHIAFPHIWLAAWALGRAFESLSWREIFAKGGWLLPVSLFFLWRAWAAFADSSDSIAQVLQQSGAGRDLALTIAQLQPLGRSLGGVLGIVIFSGLFFAAVNRAGIRRSIQLIGLTLAVLLAALTVRTMVMANYLQDEYATEFLVYAHSTPDVKEALDRIEQVSWRLTGTPDELQVAYGAEVAWPFYWYLDTRYSNRYYFESPARDQLLASPVIIAGRSEWADVEEIVGGMYDVFDGKHIWWPIEDYRDLTWTRVRATLSDSEMRQALWNIIWNRDYRQYARLKNPDDPFTFNTWPHRMEFRLYVRRDLAEQVWDYAWVEGAPRSQQASGDVQPELGADPYAEQVTSVSAEVVARLPDAAHAGIALAPDGSFYVADAAQHLIWHHDGNGEQLGVWGGYGARPGEFNMPSGVAVDNEGHVYVADTWNHRIQKFSADGELLVSWGRYAEVAAQDRTGYGAFYGPRGVAVGRGGNVYVTDTGNHRVQVFDPMGRFIRAFGGAGEGTGEMREPVGIAVTDREVFVADTWHQKIQVFNLEGMFVREWAVPVWAFAATDDRPVLAVRNDRVIATDPAYQRLLIFDAQGELQQVVADGTNSFTPAGVAATADALYVTLQGGGDVLAFPWRETP